MVKRRTVIRHTVLATTASLGLAVFSGASAKADTKIPKHQADYQDSPNHGHQCAACCMFAPGKPDHCTMIEGVISPRGWCKYWQAGPADTCS